MKNEREERARDHLSRWGQSSRGEFGDAYVRMLLAFADDELERAAVAAEADEKAGRHVRERFATTIRTMKGDPA